MEGARRGLRRCIYCGRYYKPDLRARKIQKSCQDAKCRAKGRVERAIRTLRKVFFNTVEKYASLKALNHAPHEWVDNKNHTIVCGKQTLPACR